MNVMRVEYALLYRGGPESLLGASYAPGVGLGLTEGGAGAAPAAARSLVLIQAGIVASTHTGDGRQKPKRKLDGNGTEISHA